MLKTPPKGPTSDGRLLVYCGETRQVAAERQVAAGKHGDHAIINRVTTYVAATSTVANSPSIPRKNSIAKKHAEKKGAPGSVESPSG